MEPMSVKTFQRYRTRTHEKDYLLIDVRQPVEYMDAHIPGAILIPLKEFEERSIDLNIAGSTREMLFTAYKERAIRIAMYLFEHGP